MPRAMTRRGRLRLVRLSPANAPEPAPGRFGAAAASLVIPGLGQVLQSRWRVGVCHLLATIGFCFVVAHRPWLPFVALLACSIGSAAEAARADRLARRATLRLI